MTVEGTRQDIISIQMLRGIAALMVVFVHIDVQLERLGYPVLASHWMARGVDIFFVISGFIMWISAERKPDMDAAMFMRNRIVRIVPLYWALTAGIVSVALVAPDLLHTTRFEAGHALKSFLFIPSVHPTTGLFWPILIPGWTLNMEMAFYLLFAIAIAASAGRAKSRFFWIAGLLLGLFALANLLDNRIEFLRFYSNPIIFEFLAGVILGIVYRRGVVPMSGAWFVVLALGFALFWWLPGIDVPQPLAAGLAATMVVAGALFSPSFRLKSLELLGDASYSLYLSHVVSLAAFTAAWNVTGLAGLPIWAYIPTALLFTLAVAFLLYHIVERRLTAAFRPKATNVRTALPA